MNEALKLFNENIKLAYAAVHKYYGTQHPLFDDLTQAALLGLWRSLETFDSNKGEVRHHAINFIMDECNEVLRHRSVVSVPKYQYKVGVRVQQEFQEFNDERTMALEDKVDKKVYLEEVLSKIQDKINAPIKYKGSKRPAILRMYFLEGKTSKEISKALGTTKQGTNTAIKALRQEIKALCY